MLWPTVIGDHDQYLAAQRMNWLDCNSHEDAAKEMFYYDSPGFASYSASENQLSRNIISSRSKALEVCQV